MRKMMTVAGVLGCLAGMLGCGSGRPDPAPLRPQAFRDTRPTAVPPRPATAPVAIAPATRPQAPATAPTISLGSYMTLGLVVAEANGQPIFADKVLAHLDPELSAKARQQDMTPATFRRIATGLIKDQIELEIFEELEFAAADRASTDEERNQASALTTNWRQKEIIRHGGSLAVTRQFFADRGKDFDEEVQDQFRKYLVLIHYQARVFPLVSVTAEDLRTFYNQNVEKLFAEKAQVRFRVIKVQVRGDKPKAMETAKDLLRRAKEEKDFGALATAYNDDPVLRRNAGWVDMSTVTSADGSTKREPAWIERGTLGKLEAVEKAAFELEVGQVSDIIDTADGLFIAKLEDKKGGKVKAFEDPETQDFIYRKLRTEQQKGLRDRERAKLLATSVSRKDEKSMQMAVDMAMQRYAVLLKPNGK